MDDLISRKELLESIEDISVKGNVLDDDWVYRFVQEFPSIDAVPVVKCNDCKYAHMTYDGECKYCDIWFPDEAEYLDGDYYCASAERKES